MLIKKPVFLSLLPDLAVCQSHPSAQLLCIYIHIYIYRKLSNQIKKQTMESFKTFVGTAGPGVPIGQQSHHVLSMSSLGPKLVNNNASGFTSTEKNMSSKKDPNKKDKDVYFYIMWRS